MLEEWVGRIVLGHTDIAIEDWQVTRMSHRQGDRLVDQIQCPKDVLALKGFLGGLVCQ